MHPFGTVYSTNITPDKKTGIGEYIDADFLNAMHKGVAKDWTILYPAMPYVSYTYMTEEDALAIKAYLFSLVPVAAVAPANTLSFRYNQRWAMGLWSTAFNRNKRFEPVVDRSAEWNRGAYQAEAVSNCGEVTHREMLGLRWLIGINSWRQAGDGSPKTSLATKRQGSGNGSRRRLLST